MGSGVGGTTVMGGCVASWMDVYLGAMTCLGEGNPFSRSNDVLRGGGKPGFANEIE